MLSPKAKKFLNLADMNGNNSGRKFAIKKKFALTTEGFMAHLPPDARETDVVCLLRGLRFPCVLRKVELGRYERAGGCYVHAYWDWDLLESGLDAETLESFELC